MGNGLCQSPYNTPLNIEHDSLIRCLFYSLKLTCDFVSYSATSGHIRSLIFFSCPSPWWFYIWHIWISALWFYSTACVWYSQNTAIEITLRHYLRSWMDKWTILTFIEFQNFTLFSINMNFQTPFIDDTCTLKLNWNWPFGKFIRDSFNIFPFLQNNLYIISPTANMIHPTD